MKPTIKTLGDVLYSQSQYIIPVFQRNYRWEEPQWAQMWESLEEIQAPEKRGNHFMGFLVFVPGLAQPGQPTAFHLIDGQQRLTTLSILLVAIRNIAEKMGQQDLAKEIQDYFLVHPNRKHDERFRLLPKERDHDSYISIVERKGSATGRIAGALEYFEGRLSASLGDDPEALKRLSVAVCNRFEFMCATLESENAYNIFKSLNSTGVPLGASDLIRNFVFMQTPPHEHDELDGEWWSPLEAHFARTDGTLDEDRFSDFFRDFLMSEGRYVRPRETFASFEARYEATGFVWLDLAKTLAKSVHHYSIITGRALDEDPGVSRALAHLNALESSTTYPLLLVLFEHRASGKLGADQLAHAIEMLCGFIMRRFISGESSRGYGTLFVRANVRNSTQPIAALESYLLERGWPDDKRFIKAFEEFPLFERGYTREVLVELERRRGHKEPADLGSAQVEHILPQKLSDAWRAALGPEADRIHAEWLHRPGNLTLSAYNQELWNHPFATKRSYYAASNIGLTRQLAENDQWTEVEMRTRGRTLALQAVSIWIGPKEPMPKPSPNAHAGAEEGPGTETTRLQLEFWTEFNNLVGERNGVIHPRKPQPQHWMDYSLGDSRFGLQVSMKTAKRHISVSLSILGPDAKLHFQKLRQQREDIEKLLGSSVMWWELPERISSFITLYRYDSPLRERNTWPEQHKWLLETLELFHHAFAQRVKQLDSE